MFKSCIGLLPAKHADTNSAYPDQTDQGFPCLLPCQHFCEFKPRFYLRTSCQPYRPRQTMQTQIRQLLKLQSDQSLHCLLLCQHFCEFKPTFYLRTSCLRYSPRQTEQIQIRLLLNGVFPVCYSVSIFVNFSLVNQHFI